jgi:hypothetical protein
MTKNSNLAFNVLFVIAPLGMIGGLAIILMSHG